MARTGHPVTLSTKIFHSTDGVAGDTGLAPDRIRRQIRSSLERLGVERVDMYLVHEPDPETPLADTLRVLDELVARGAGRLDRRLERRPRRTSRRRGDLGARGPARFEWVQNSYSLLDREAEEGVLPFCAEHGLGFTPFSPLAGGWLTGKYTRDQPPSGRLADDDAARSRTCTCRPTRSTTAWTARRRGGAAAASTCPTLATAWVLSHPHVTGIVCGPRRPAHLWPSSAPSTSSSRPASATALVPLPA